MAYSIRQQTPSPRLNWGGVFAPNGKIYLVPNFMNNIDLFDPSTNSATDYCMTSGGVLALNGKIYFVPHRADKIGTFDLSTNTFTMIDMLGAIMNEPTWVHDKYAGGVLAHNGKIYFIRHDVTLS